MHAGDEPCHTPKVHWLLVTIAAYGAEGLVALSVAVHRDAGTLAEIAADGAAGQCALVEQTLSCPARGPVSFRWGAGEDWVLTGDTVLAPGERGVAAVWAAEALREDALARLAGPVTAEVVADLFVRTGDHPIAPPSAAEFAALLALAEHPDARVRREVVDALLPYWRHTASDPFPPGAPSVVPASVLERLAADESEAVRKRLASRLRDLQAPGEPMQEVANEILLRLAANEEDGVQRAAFASLAIRSRRGETPGLDAWRVALDRVTTPGPPGRAAANTLAALAVELEVGPDVDPRLAMERASEHQLERVWKIWKAWRADVPFEPLLAERLLRETVGMSPVLFASWAEDDPDGLAAVLRRWEPAAPHSERYVYLLSGLPPPVSPALKPLADDTLSPVPGATGAQ